MTAVERLRAVKTRLCGPAAGGDPRERLRAAAEYLPDAVTTETWPTAFRIEAERVRTGLLGFGVGESVETDETAVRRLTRDLRLLCDKIERFSAGHRRTALRAGARLSR